MLRKLSILAALVFAIAVSTPKPSPAIDFICSCNLCKGHSGPACRDLDGIHPMWTSCGAYYPTHCG
jgi:hypothetical protein